MIHMLSAFDLKPGQSEAEFLAAYSGFLAELVAADLIVASGPMGRRVTGTPMDTDPRTHTHYSILTFRDRDQLDRAYAHIDARRDPAAGTHFDMYRRLAAGPVFTCWEDEAAPDQA